MQAAINRKRDGVRSRETERDGMMFSNLKFTVRAEIDTCIYASFETQYMIDVDCNTQFG